ncbi:phosphotransferase family protein [Paracoccus sp. SCSIO 75233]|uniref:phosphotransferase family protein n=1 Tax=Paracoccus sp. SCSIO 75233 TaxID=3017782 RepID=UPI0022F13E47|nr:phosphotransferase family protein [Paracoccus sp. SCSIO 75233]WBU52975.1 phosphotransferase family protein [Paracoccus sp. SCSIO 75233]
MSKLDVLALKRWLGEKLPVSDRLELTRIGGGQSNPTWFVDYGDHRMVLRKKPDGPILKGAHAVEREFRVMRALADTDVPVPRVLWLEEDETVLGTPFYLMERLEGRVFHHASLPDQSPEERRAIYLEMARVLARLHAARPEDIGLADFGRPGNYFDRQIARWSRQYRESSGPRIPALDRMSDWLAENVPPDDGAVSIAHGDFRLGNLMFHPNETRVIGVLDWELSTLGHPLADLGYAAMIWRSTPDEYGGIRGTGWQDAGVPTEAEFVREYYANAIPTSPLLPFHIAFAMFRFSVIFVGIADRVRAGNAAAENADKLGPLAERFAILSEEAIQEG